MTELKRTEEYIDRIRAAQPEMTVVDYERSKRTLAYLARVLSALYARRRTEECGK